MSTTPRTDMEVHHDATIAEMNYQEQGWVKAGFVRTLERELAAMTKDRDSWRQQNNDRVADLLKMSGKRDSALADLNDLRRKFKERSEECDALRAKMECYDPYFRELDLLRHERDALRAELAQFQQPTHQEQETT